MQKLYLLLFLFVSSIYSNAQTFITKEIHINPDTFVTSTDTSFPYIVFNETDVFDQMNAVVVVNQYDTLVVHIVNHDSINHNVSISGYSFSSPAILPGDTISDTIVCIQSGLFSIVDMSNYPYHLYMGLGAMLHVLPSTNNHAQFYWNIKEHHLEWNYLIRNGATVDWTTYDPDYFTLNGNGKPDIANDSSAIIRGNVGDTIYINILNTGRSIHSLHFHGYHITVLASDKQPEKVGWEKDTYPLVSEEAAIMQLIPDKEGLYPVHNHNLIGVTGGGIYPNGIFLIMDIKP